MPMIPVNLNNVSPAGDFEVYPAGIYTLQVVETKQEPSKNSGEMKLTVGFRIIDGPDGGTDLANRKITRSYPLTKALGFLKRLQLALGINDQMLAAAGGLSEEMLQNGIIKARVTVRDYGSDGRKTNDVNEMVPEQGQAVQQTMQTQQPQYPAAVPQGFQPPPAQYPPQPQYPPQQQQYAQQPQFQQPPVQQQAYPQPQPQYPSQNGGQSQFQPPTFAAPAPPKR